MSPTPLLAVLVAVYEAAEGAEAVAPLSARSILVTLAIILAVAFAIVLAGLGYFSPSDDGDHH